MLQLIKLLKDMRAKMLDYQQKTNRNMFLCAFGLEFSQKELNEINGSGFKPMIAYFPAEKMAWYEINLIENNNFPNYSIAGVTLVESKMLYFATTRINAGKKMIAKQKNWDHLYQNQKINVFETEELFVRFLYKSDDFENDYLYESMESNIKNSLDKYPSKSVNDMQYTLTAEGILQIEPTASLASQMVV